jgi:hypothetical protein
MVSIVHVHDLYIGIVHTKEGPCIIGVSVGPESEPDAGHHEDDFWIDGSKVGKVRENTEQSEKNY